MVKFTCKHKGKFMGIKAASKQIQNKVISVAHNKLYSEEKLGKECIEMFIISQHSTELCEFSLTSVKP